MRPKLPSVPIKYGLRIVELMPWMTPAWEETIVANWEEIEGEQYNSVFDETEIWYQIKIKGQGRF